MTTRRIDAPCNCNITETPNGPRFVEGDKDVVGAALERADAAAREQHRAGPPAGAMTRENVDARKRG